MKKFVLPTITILCLMVGFLIGHTSSQNANASQINWAQFWAPSSKIDQMLQLMSEAYVDPINVDSITETIMQDLVQKLDPHSYYISKNDLEEVNSELSASFSGIGVQFNIQQDTVCVVAVVSGGPSEGVGVLAGDKIILVNDSIFTFSGINNEKVMKTLRGPKDTQVKLSVKRNGVKELLHYTITRGDIPVHSVDAAFMMPGNVGYIRVNKFAATTYNEFMVGMTNLKSQGAQSYIIDLRENGGGFMDQAINMCNEFLSADDLIVYSEGRAYRRFEAKANGLGRFQDAKIVVLIDEFSASASEIFAGAMQDNDRATVIGRRSFGKGLVQQQLDLGDGSAIRLTVARYYTPSGRCIQKPYTLGVREDYDMDWIKRLEQGEMYSADSIHLKDTTKYFTKQGRVVYGGGGIMPDVFVGRDTSLNTPFYNKCVNLAYTYQFAFKYTNDHRTELKKTKNWQALEQYLDGKDIVGEFVRYASTKGVNANDSTLLHYPLSVAQQIEKSRPLLKRLLTAYIVRDVFGDEGFWAIYEREDEITLRALKEIEK